MKPNYSESLRLSGLLVLTAEVERPEKARVQADFVRWNGCRVTVAHRNAFVNTGLQIDLKLLFGISGPPGAVSHVGVSSSTSAVTAATVFLNGASGGAAANTIIKAISPAAAIASQTVTAGATFGNADFTSGVFAIAKVGLLNTSTDAGTGLIDVIGGTGGTAPYNKTFAVDFTNAGAFTLGPQILVTASAA